MKLRRGQRLSVLILVVGFGVATVSCRQESKSTVDVREIRGEPIAPAPAAANPPTAVAKSEIVTAASPQLAPRQTVQDDPASSEPFVLGFDKLSAFTYDMPSDLLSTNRVDASDSSGKIPTAVRAFDKRFVALKGFMLPLKVEGGLVTELLIMRDQSMCCYGTVPKINEWVSVKMNGKGVKPVMDQTVTLIGTLHVGEVRENGYLVGIYQLDGDRITSPPGL